MAFSSGIVESSALSNLSMSEMIHSLISNSFLQFRPSFQIFFLIYLVLKYQLTVFLSYEPKVFSFIFHRDIILLLIIFILMVVILFLSFWKKILLICKEEEFDQEIILLPPSLSLPFIFSFLCFPTGVMICHL